MSCSSVGEGGELLGRRELRTRRISTDDLATLRSLDLKRVLEALGYYVAVDRTFEPRLDATSERWLVSDEVGTTELVVTGVKWFDAREGKGGGGAIDLVMHLRKVAFSRALVLVRSVCKT